METDKATLGTGVPARSLVRSFIFSPPSLGDRFALASMKNALHVPPIPAAFEMVDEGFIAKLLVPEGTRDITVGTPIAIMVEDEGDVAAFKDYKAAGGPATAAATAAAAAPAAPKAAAPAAHVHEDAGDLKIGPGIRFTMAEAGVSTGQPHSSGSCHPACCSWDLSVPSFRPPLALEAPRVAGR